ncbi:MarR family winged helix-turn-helix transcriptional regulator [Gryllotalpicola ginsengisoli]|uniref:MarR family winged helix-turn-helix transcriptional regulator n=1 Tax=Gryllotalpicola ginsengisoli TaxID=444608 RepID=UPI0003B72C46|nr:MarR family transcriptional regulator [Gryllotalpicola ginsengisoli]
MAGRAEERQQSEGDPGTADVVLTASRALLAIVARSVAPALEVVSLPQFRVLVLLSTDGPTRVGSLAEHVGANPSTFSRSVDRMVAAGWVVRTGNPESRREVLLELTDDGRWLVESVTARRRREIETVLERMPPSQRAALVRALRSFSEAAGEASVGDLLTLGL